MAMLRSYRSGALLRGLGSRFFRSVTSDVNNRNSYSYWKSPQATVVPNFNRPMSTSEVKKRWKQLESLLWVEFWKGLRIWFSNLTLITSIRIFKQSLSNLHFELDMTSIEELRTLRLITAVKTPYLANGQFDLETYDNLVNMQIANGVEGILVAGTTGEGYLMSWNDQIMLIGHTVNCFGDKVKVIGNAGSNCTSEAITATEQGFAVGMDAALHISPYYGKTSMDGLLAHYNSVLSIGPLVIYNIPSRTAQEIPPSVVETLAQNPNLVGIKECVGNDRIKKYTSEGLSVWSGNDEESHEARWDCGATGVHTVAGNLIPGLMRELMFGGKNPKLNSKLMPLFDWLAIEPCPIAVNTALAQLGVIRPVFRLPHVPLSVEQRREFVKLVKELGREHFVGEKDVQVLDDDDFITVSRY